MNVPSPAVLASNQSLERVEQQHKIWTRNELIAKLKAYLAEVAEQHGVEVIRTGIYPSAEDLDIGTPILIRQYLRLTPEEVAAYETAISDQVDAWIANLNSLQRDIVAESILIDFYWDPHGYR
jgi:hypothetical protein